MSVKYVSQALDSVQMDETSANTVLEEYIDTEYLDTAYDINNCEDDIEVEDTTASVDDEAPVNSPNDTEELVYVCYSVLFTFCL